MKIVVKWVAGFWMNNLVVTKWKFSETAESFCVIKEDCEDYRQAIGALGYKSRIPKDSDLVHATATDALDFLHQREMGTLRPHNEAVERIQDRLNRIDDFELTTE